MRRLVSASLVLALLLPLAPLGGAATPAGQVVVAVIDTGIDAQHREFAPGQVVAWWDFSTERTGSQRFPLPTESWDPRVQPYDTHGHGTATASLVAGANLGSCGATAPKKSFAPGAKLVVAKVSMPSGSVAGNGATVDASLVPRAIDWAVAQGADVVSMSLGGQVPDLGIEPAVARARAAGRLVVVAAGNGAGNLGVAPTPTWMTDYGNDPKVLAVGGGSVNAQTAGSTTGNLDPDVTSWSDSVCVAARATGDGYKVGGGTSYAAPLVAGMAAKAMEIARANGRSAHADRIEAILQYAAMNTASSPYAREGLGFLLDRDYAGQLGIDAHEDAWTRVQSWAAGDLTVDQMTAAYDAQGPWAEWDRFYHDEVADSVRGLP